ncbi:BAG domain-containing protein [Yamadazyma tenuis ATCC 10573]|uniref:BAG domain-containing protein n=1 Tax=Candida tenuis (strain ATCC 10573 / BCRC 21748 / CBS 615 / JCM 9827 / NBRC 10315 / NRRL Y-1498 / VKM Y-70) TaxID=590646 RepID=G3B5C3_CANTC|nr:BAG domain-containing protein [Yamadazyma tenuis ATCC 10573]EGV63183.1 BAG domain-containing protein [Yamadazyma tenuis ATCC 10573]
MEQITEKVNDVIAVIPPKLEQLQQYFKHHFVQDVESYIDEFKSLDSDQVLESFKQLKVNSVTVTISIVGLTTLFVLGRLLFGGSSATSEEKPKKKKKKTSKAKKANKQIQDLLDNFETTWVPQINDYFNDYKTMKPEDAQYKYKYFQEMLLKELFKLDEVDTLGNPVIRENRKKVIQFIQDHQKRLDAFKKEVDL